MRLQHILVPVDFSDHSDAAVAHAIRLARESKGVVHLLHAFEIPLGTVPPYGVEMPSTMLAGVRDAAARRIEKLRAKAEEAGVACETHLTEEAPSPAIVAKAQALHADLIVMGTRGLSGLKHVLLGSTTERTVRTAPCPVLSVKAGAPPPARFARIVVAADFSKHCEQVLDLAIDLAKHSAGEILVVHAYEMPTAVTAAYGIAIPQSVWTEMEQAAADRLASLTDRVKAAGVAVTTHLATAPASDAITEVAAAQHADVIVMGTRGRVGLQHLLLGSVAERTLRLAPCPVLTVRCAES